MPCGVAPCRDPPHNILSSHAFRFMDDLSPSKDARQRAPYRSLYASILFQSFRDALDDAMRPDPDDRAASPSLAHRSRRANASTPARQA